MKLLLKRTFKGDSYTIGHLYKKEADDKLTFICDTIEDVYRDLEKEKKVAGETCIPYGIYDITIKVQSPKYLRKFEHNPDHSLAYTNGYMPRLLNVPHFEGVLIHTGNTQKDSEGCLIVGENKVKGQVINSTKTFKKLYELLLLADKAGEDITIEIV